MSDLIRYKAFCRKLLDDFIETRRLTIDLIKLEKHTGFSSSVDPAHLVRSRSNLLSNAIRHASANPGSVRIIPADLNWAAGIAYSGRWLTGIPYEVRAHLFGAILYNIAYGDGLVYTLARELCLNNHSLLDYRIPRRRNAGWQF